MTIRPDDIAVILSTGYSKQISKEKAEEMGIDDLVAKPLNQHELANTVRRVLDEKPRNTGAVPLGSLGSKKPPESR